MGEASNDASVLVLTLPTAVEMYDLNIKLFCGFIETKFTHLTLEGECITRRNWSLRPVPILSRVIPTKSIMSVKRNSFLKLMNIKA